MRTATKINGEGPDSLISKILNSQQNPVLWIADELVRALLNGSGAGRAEIENREAYMNQQVQQMHEYAHSALQLQNDQLLKRVMAILEARSVAATEAALVAYRQARELGILRQYNALLQFGEAILPLPQRDKIKAGLLSLGRQYERLGYLLQDTELTLVRRDSKVTPSQQKLTRASMLRVTAFEQDLEMIDDSPRRVVLTPGIHAFDLIGALAARGYEVLASRAMALPAIPQHQERLKRCLAGRFSFAANA